MKKSIFIPIFLMLLGFILLSGCINIIDSETVPKNDGVCNKPYISHGTECCLDKNSNSICDFDESKQSSEVPTENEMNDIQQAYKDAYTSYNNLLQEKGSNSAETKAALKEYEDKYDYYMSLKETFDSVIQDDEEFNRDELIQQDAEDVFYLPKAQGTLFELEDAYGLELIDFDGDYTLFQKDEARGPQLDYGDPKPEFSWRKLETLYRHNYSSHGLKTLPQTTIDSSGREQAIRHLFGEISQGKFYWQRPGGHIYVDDSSNPIMFQLEKPLDQIGSVFDVTEHYFLIITRPPAKTHDGYMVGCDNIYLYDRGVDNYRIITDDPTFELATKDTKTKCPVKSETIELKNNIVTWVEYLFEKPLSDVDQDVEGIRVFASIAGLGQPLLMFENSVSRFNHYDVTSEYFVYLNKGDYNVDDGDLRMKYIDPDRLDESKLLISHTNFKSKDPMKPSLEKKPYKKFIIAATDNKVAFAVEYNTQQGKETKNKVGLFLYDIKKETTELIFEKEMARISVVFADNGRVVFSVSDMNDNGIVTKWTAHHYIFEINK